MKKPNILSIDDEPSFTVLLKEYFEPRGYDIDITSAGDKGLELLHEKKYDVVLLDLRMAGLDGGEVMAEINRSNAGTKIIFITAYNDSGKTRERLMGEGAYAFMEKPITSLKRLEELVNRAVKAD
ncbi:MAG: response regulator [Candidatus Omnitrophota bacterium]|nr:response regulator [Candidatus Omnitrophota bacterium]